MRYVAFLRAVNVGGRVVKMAQLRALCESIPLDSVATFIASGNVIFESAKAPVQLETLIEEKLMAGLGYEVTTMVRAVPELQAIVKHVTERALEEGGTTRLYVGFLKMAPTAAKAKAAGALSNDSDVLSVKGRELYWICRSPLTESTVAGAKLERLLLGQATFRNFNTVRRLAERLT